MARFGRRSTGWPPKPGLWHELVEDRLRSLTAICGASIYSAQRHGNEVRYDLDAMPTDGNQCRKCKKLSRPKSEPLAGQPGINPQQDHL